ncbi:MFS transporter [Leuconostoc inhae]|uniref:MFS transporter n=1 Tax=Leuconostoc inhae TaxID=178001 RepID=UPI001FE36D42|nr:MFS transporter [Leuconostoc inhae]
MSKNRSGMIILGLFFGVFVTGADSFIISPILPEIATSFKTSVGLTAYGVTIYALCFAFGSPIFGPLGDKYNKKKLLITGIVVFFLGTMLCGFSTNLLSFYIYRAVAGVGASMFVPNVWAFIGSNFDGKRLNHVMGIVMSALSLSIAVGVPLGTTLAQISDWHMAFWGSAVLTFIVLVLIAFIPNQNAINPNARMSYIKSFKNVFLAKNAVIALMITLTWMIGFYSVYTFLGTYIQSTFGFDVAMTGYIFIAYGLSNFIASFFGGKVMTLLGKKRSINLNASISIIIILGLMISENNILILILLLILLAFAQGFGVTSLNAYIVNLVPSNRSTLMALNSSSLYLGLTFGSGIGGQIYEIFGFLGVCSMAIIGFLIAQIITKFLKNN